MMRRDRRRQQLCGPVHQEQHVGPIRKELAELLALAVVKAEELQAAPGASDTF